MVTTSCDLYAPRCVTSPAGTFSRVPGRCLHWSPTPRTPVTPCIIIIVIIRKGEERRKKKREVLHLFRCYTHTHTHTHTHTRQEPGQPWKARGRKKRTQTTGQQPKQRRGGREQTDLRNQPTWRNGPDKKQGTHLNPTTHYGEAARGGKLGTKWGTSWWRK